MNDKTGQVISPETLSKLGELTKKFAAVSLGNLSIQDDMPDELERIFWHRLCFRIYNFSCLAVALKKYPSSYPVLYRNFFEKPDWLNICKRMAESLYKQFKHEILEFRKNNKEPIFETLEKAKRGDNNSIYKLVKWDKAWIGIDFIHARIISSQDSNDRLFLERLSDALRKKSGIKPAPQKENENLLFLIQLIASRYDLSIENGLKRLHEDLDKGGWFDGTKEIKALSEYKYFVKYLKYHKIIGEKKT